MKVSDLHGLDFWIANRALRELRAAADVEARRRVISALRAQPWGELATVVEADFLAWWSEAQEKLGNAATRNALQSM